MKKLTDCPLVKITWKDAHGVSTDWERWDKFKKEDQEPVEIFSVGYLVVDEDEYKTIASHIDNTQDQPVLCGKMTIPDGGIIRIETLTIGKLFNQ